MSRHRAISVCATTRSSGPNSAQQRTIDGGKRCQTLAEFPLVEATIGPIDVNLCLRWMYGVQIPSTLEWGPPELVELPDAPLGAGASVLPPNVDVVDVLMYVTAFAIHMITLG
jgi:hypothetical protein